MRRQTINLILPFLWPDIRRGPAYEDWIKAMKELGKDMQLSECKTCGGDCPTDARTNYDAHTAEALSHWLMWDVDTKTLEHFDSSAAASGFVSQIEPVKD